MKLLPLTRGILAIAGVASALAIAELSCASTPAFDPGAGGVAAGTGGSAAGGGSGSSSGTVACKTPEDCSGDQTDCAHRTCTAGVCGIEDTAQGFLVGTQTSGDCQKTVCDGKGATVSVADDADKPDDSNDCTTDVCQAGVPSHPPTAKGTPCGATQQLTCDGTGKCGGCKQDAECGINGPCVSYSCDLGTMVCGHLYVMLGQGDPGGQQTGDCKKVVCNGSGGTATQPDDADKPIDGNPCTQDLCVMGNASNANLPPGTPCGANSTCDFNATCGCGDPGACTNKCGSLTNLCGKPVTCPSCPGANDVCQANACVCSDPGACTNKCGSLTDLCGKPVTCPSCPGANDVCQANACVCSDPGACTNKCGSLTNLCGKPVTCPSCPGANDVCQANACVCGGIMCGGQCTATATACATPSCGACGTNAACDGSLIDDPVSKFKTTCASSLGPCSAQNAQASNAPDQQKYHNGKDYACGKLNGVYDWIYRVGSIAAMGPGCLTGYPHCTFICTANIPYAGFCNSASNWDTNLAGAPGDGCGTLPAPGYACP